MGKLAFAGAIGGMGQGLQQGLINMQSGIIQSGLQDERFKHDAQAVEADRAFQMSKMGVQHGHELRLKQDDYAETRARDQEKMGTDILKQTIHDVNEDRRLADKQTFEHGEREDDRAITREKNRNDAEADREKNATTKQHYRDWKDVSGAIKAGKAGGASSSDKIDMEARKAGAAFYSSRIAPLEKQLIDPMTPDGDKKAISERIEMLTKEGLGVLGFQFDDSKSKKRKVDLGKDDPFADQSPLAGKAGSGESQAPVKESSTTPAPSPRFLQMVEPNRPAQRRGAVPVEEAKRTAQQQLDYDIFALRQEIEKAQGTPSRIQSLKERLANLLRQKE